MGTKAWENAPSANIRRRMLGRRKATSKASIAAPAPKKVALRLSRASPVMRETRVIPLTVVRVRRRFKGSEGGGRRPLGAFRQQLVWTAKTGYYHWLTQIYPTRGSAAST